MFKKIYTISVSSLMLFLILIYNHRRIFGCYQFGFHNKQIDFELLSVLEFDVIFMRFFPKPLIKIAFFCVLGVLLLSVLSLYGGNIKRRYCIGGISLILFIETLVAFTTGDTVGACIDINNHILYLAGLVLGYPSWLIAKKILPHFIAFASRLLRNIERNT